jgi:hypothetical protein
MTIEGIETYLLRYRDPADLSLLVEAVRSNPGPMDLDVVIGIRGSVASPEMCNGLSVPIVVLDQVYSFDREAIIKAIPRPDKVPAKEFAAKSRRDVSRQFKLRPVVLISMLWQTELRAKHRNKKKPSKRHSRA